MPDRTVHGVSLSGGWEVVRYERSGKWYIEAQGERRRVGVDRAASISSVGSFYPGLSGGRVFDRKVREMRRRDAG